MTEILWAALLIMTAIAVFLAWKLDQRTRELIAAEQDWQNLFKGYQNVQARNDTLEKESLAFAAYRREVEEQGAASVEVQRLRNANTKLAIYAERATERLDELKEAMVERGHEDLLREIYKGLDEPVEM